MSADSIETGRPVPQACPIAIVAAMKEEIRQIGRRVEDSRSRGLIECEALSGRIGQCRVTVATTGDGAKAATRGLEALLNAEVKISGVNVSAITDDTFKKVYRGQQLVLFGKYEKGGRVHPSVLRPANSAAI